MILNVRENYKYLRSRTENCCTENLAGCDTVRIRRAAIIKSLVEPVVTVFILKQPEKYQY